MTRRSRSCFQNSKYQQEDVTDASSVIHTILKFHFWSKLYQKKGNKFKKLNKKSNEKKKGKMGKNREKGKNKKRGKNKKKGEKRKKGKKSSKIPHVKI